MKCNLHIQKYIKNLTVLDYILFGLIALFCFLLFSHVDASTTAHNASTYLNGNILNFYSACHDLHGGYGANYLPTTFIFYALWDIPLKLFSLLPESWGVWSAGFTLWSKLLPTIFYFFSAYIIYKICLLRLKLNIKDSKLAVILFLTSPIGFYSQFIFGQYDIFTVFFMILGIYYYFDQSLSRKSLYRFVLFFSIAITLKYFAILIFLVLLLLKEKRIWMIIKNTILALLPAVFLAGIYYIFDQDAFIKSVFGFQALDYTQNSGFPIAGFVNIQCAPILVILIFAFSYFTKYKSEKEFFSYSMHFCCGICFVLFGLMNWHPQWLLFAVFFWNMSFIMHSQTSVFLWIDLIFGIVFNIFVSVTYTNSADQALLKNGIFTSKLYYKETETLSMADIYPFGDRDLCFAILFAIMLIYFIYSHPRFSLAQNENGMQTKQITGLIRGRFLIWTLSFIIPALICLPSIISQFNNLWQYHSESSDHNPVSFDEYGSFTQTVVLNGNSISEIEVSVGTYGEELQNTSITLTIKNSTGDTIGTATIDNTVIYDGTLTFNVGIVPIENGETYYFTFDAAQGPGEHLALFTSEYEGDINLPLRTYQRHYNNNFVTSANKDMGNNIIEMKILGDK